MQPKNTYPQWFHTFRGFIIGLAVGCAATTLAYDSNVIPLDNSISQQVFFPLVMNGVPWFVLALFEIYFGIQRYRALRREMDDWAAAA